MSAHPSVSVWTDTLNHLLGDLQKPIRKALALMSMAMALARNCHSSRIACAAPTTTVPASSRRRLERLLANPHLNSEAVTASLVRSLALAYPNRRWILIIDETDRDEKIRSMQILLAF